MLLRDFVVTPIYPQINCTNDVLRTELKAACATGFGPRFTNYSDLHESWYVSIADKSNPFASKVKDPSSAPWQWHRVKSPSRGNGWEAQAYTSLAGFTGISSLKCDAFPDIANSFYVDGGVGNTAKRSDWLTFRMTLHSWTALQGSKSMRVLACYGSRRGNWGINPDWKVQFGVQGKAVGKPVSIVGPYYFSNCHEVVSGAPLPKVNDVFGFYFDWGNSTRKGIDIMTVVCCFICAPSPLWFSKDRKSE